MNEIKHEIEIKSTAVKVYEAITSNQGLSNWWTHTTGESKVGSSLSFYFGNKDEPTIKLQVEALESNQLVAWKIISGPDEWLETEILFNLKENKEMTVVQFQHKDWKSNEGSFPHCNTKWAVFLVSLKQLIEDGKGRPFPNDIQIK